jgi:hypothetical protein
VERLAGVVEDEVDGGARFDLHPLRCEPQVTGLDQDLVRAHDGRLGGSVAGPLPAHVMGHVHRVASPPSSAGTGTCDEGGSDEQGRTEATERPPRASWCSARRNVGEDLAPLPVLVGGDLAAGQPRVQGVAGGRGATITGLAGRPDGGDHDEQQPDAGNDHHVVVLPGPAARAAEPERRLRVSGP